MDYCTLDEVRGELGLAETDDSHDDMIQGMIEQAKELIDMFCNRSFDAQPDTTKYYDGSASPLFIDDLVSITGDNDGIFLDEDGDGTYEVTMATTDYHLYPLNKTPKTRIEINPEGGYGGFASGIRKGVKIIATWGYSLSLAKPIKRASIIQVCRWFKRRESAFADVIGGSITGELVMYKELDPDIKLIINQFRKRNI